MVYTLLSGPMVYTPIYCFPRKMVYTIAFFLLCDLGVGRQTEKGGVPLWWCMLSCTRLRVPPVALHVSRYKCRS